MTCEFCGAPLPPDAKTCPVCGKAQNPIPTEVEQEVAAAMEEAQAILDRHPQPSQEVPAEEEGPQPETPAAEPSPEKEAAPEVFPPEDVDREEPSLPRQVDPPREETPPTEPIHTAPLPPFPFPEEGKTGDPASQESEGEDPQPQPEDPADEGPVYARKGPRQGASRARKAPEGDPAVPSTWHYFLMQLVLGLPIIGFILSIIWGLEEDGPLHRKNFARANILYSLLKLLFQLVILGVVISLLSTIMGLLMSYGYYYDPYYGYDPYYDDFFGWYDDYGSYGESPYYYNSAGNSSYWQGDTALAPEGMESV